jgi:hypothetical protein
MTKIQWGTPGTRAYEVGLDHGVLYLPSGAAIPWNGLTSIDEDSPADTTPLYFDGIKYFDDVIRKDFSGILKAFTYPDAFAELEGTISLENGLFTGGQPRQQFDLSYRTLKANDVNSEAGHRIHILYNLVATPQELERTTVSDSPTINEFGWKLSSSPELINGFAPTSHAIIDTTLLREELLSELEEFLYGSDTAHPNLPPLNDLVTYAKDWNLILITDNGDGTWTASSNYPGFVLDNGDGTFQINDANATYLDVNTYDISNTKA